MTLVATELSFNELVEDLLRQCGADDPAAQAKYIHVVVLDALVS